MLLLRTPGQDAQRQLAWAALLRSRHDRAVRVVCECTAGKGELRSRGHLSATPSYACALVVLDVVVDPVVPGRRLCAQAVRAAREHSELLVQLYTMVDVEVCYFMFMFMFMWICGIRFV
jgi:hypothetical protein